MTKIILLFFCIVASCLAVPVTEWKSVFSHPNERHSTLPTLRIINGQTAKPHQFPYQVGMYLKKPQYTDFCGASLISSNYVLTAAHCVEGASSATLIFGAQNITDATEKSQVRVISNNLIIHEKWDRNQLINDIALVKLPSPISETAGIKVVPVATGSDSYDDSDGFIAGWGVTKTSQRGVTQILQFTHSPIMSNDECSQVDQNYNAIMKDSLMCLSSGSQKVGTCQGDSGGPLVVKGVQVGVVSFGPTDCESGKPSVFTRLTEYEEWIEQHSDVRF